MKILIVRYVRNPDNYFFDIFDATSAGTLRAQGHDAVVVERILAPGFDEEDVLEGLYRFAADFAPELVFLSYMPTKTLADDLRKWTGAPIAATGSQLLLGAGIDYVLAEPDPLALVQLASALQGERPLSTVAALTWREGAQIVRSGIALHPVFDIFTLGHIDYGAFYRLGPGRPRAHRKHVVGDWGCPYRHAPSAEPVPEGMPSWVAAGGCTFCTRGAFDHRGWDVKGPVLGQQMDRVLAAFPDLAQLIVIDEHGLAQADGIANLVKARPWEDIELLISGRIDHVARHQNRLVDALKLLQEKCTLRLYQFGIENLSDSALARYNKGLTFRQIQTGLSLMLELEKNHANLKIERSFGFILFDPWTTLEELTTNVTRARQLGLDHFRGQAPFTSLRLVPEMQLYWRARAAGLLTEDLAENAFGYSVNSGWRFQDQRVGEVFNELLSHRGGPHSGWETLAGILAK